ncbi:SAM-dependent methyltransferase [Dactylosporangium sp. NPDC051485]|uniref:SAM-dependent methyltransferase n=1 Tax=Dactylosporangium sp. NPDC051485 TaxID=3154846 RepID=UPI003416D730
MTTDIYLLGSGIRGSLHFTNETVQALRTCTSVHVLHPDGMVLDYVRQQCADVRDLAHLYDGQDVRQDVYTAIANLLVEEAERRSPVAFLVHGHPLFLVSAAEYTLSLAKQRGLVTAVLPAVSSFDTLLCDLGIDYGYGVQIYDSTSLLNHGWQPNAAVPLLIFQLATTCNPLVVNTTPTGVALKPLVEFLAPIYGENHVVKIVHSGAFLVEPTETIDLPLSALVSDEIDLERRPTLYVPPAH